MAHIERIGNKHAMQLFLCDCADAIRKCVWDEWKADCVLRDGDNSTCCGIIYGTLLYKAKDGVDFNTYSGGGFFPDKRRKW